MRGHVIVGIAGGSASGKSTVVREFVRLVGAQRTAVLRHDAYYHDLSHLPMEERIRVNVDHPDSLETGLLVDHVERLRSGLAVEMPDYDYVSQTRAPRGLRVEPAPVIVVDGMLALWDDRLRALMDLAVFVDASEEDRLARRIERDTVERGRDRAEVLAQHEARVQPMHERFVAPTRERADVLIEGGGFNLRAIEALVLAVRRALDESG